MENTPIKIAAMSDTHSRHSKLKDLPEADIVIHAGDMSSVGYEWEIEKFCKWYSKYPAAVKILIAGNHDWLFEQDPKLAQEICKNHNIIYLENSGIELQMINGYPYINEDLPDIPKVKIWGSPWTPFFCDWAFNAGRDITYAAYYRKPYIKDFWDKIPKDTDILITHGPPYNILDELKCVNGDPKGQFVGCVELRKAIERIKPKLHFCGHIHCGYGSYHENGISYYNVAICDEVYYTSNEITVLEYEHD